MRSERNLYIWRRLWMAGAGVGLLAFSVVLPNPTNSLLLMLLHLICFIAGSAMLGVALDLEDRICGRGTADSRDMKWRRQWVRVRHQAGLYVEPPREEP